MYVVFTVLTVLILDLEKQKKKKEKRNRWPRQNKAKLIRTKDNLKGRQRELTPSIRKEMGGKKGLKRTRQKRKMVGRY